MFFSMDSLYIGKRVSIESNVERKTEGHLRKYANVPLPKEIMKQVLKNFEKRLKRSAKK